MQNPLKSFARGLYKTLTPKPKSITQIRNSVAATPSSPVSGFMQHYKDIESYKKGGKVKKTGLAYLHKGETVLPVKKKKKK